MYLCKQLLRNVRKNYYVIISDFWWLVCTFLKCCITWVNIIDNFIFIVFSFDLLTTAFTYAVCIFITSTVFGWKKITSNNKKHEIICSDFLRYFWMDSLQASCLFCVYFARNCRFIFNDVQSSVKTGYLLKTISKKTSR